MQRIEALFMPVTSFNIMLHNKGGQLALSNLSQTSVSAGPLVPLHIDSLYQSVIVLI